MERQRSGVCLWSVFGRAYADDALRTECVRTDLSDPDRRLDCSATWSQIAWTIPAIHVRLARFRGAVQQGPVHRQEAQIVQSCK